MQFQIDKSISEAFRQLLDKLSGMSQEQLNTVPFPGSWTPGQVGQHLLKSYGLISILDGNVAETKRPPDEKVPELEKAFLDFSIKMKSPEFILPSNDRMDKDRLLRKLQEQTTAITEYAATKDLTPTCLDFELPGAGKFTRFEWLSFVRVHTLRHIHQIKNMLPHV